MNFVPPKIRSTFIGLLGAILGYGLQQYRERATPFFEITYIGGVGLRSDPAELDRDLAERLSGSFYIGEAHIRSEARRTKLLVTSGDVYSLWDKSDDVQRVWPRIKASLEELLASRTEEDYLRNLYEVLEYRLFDHFLTNATERGGIKIPSVSEGQEIVNATYNSDENGGSYSLYFPDGRATSFGDNLARNVMRRRVCEPFITLVVSLRRDLLDELFRNFISAFDKEYAIATSVVDELKALNDGFNRWVFRVHFTNLGRRPLLVKTKLLQSGMPG